MSMGMVRRWPVLREGDVSAWVWRFGVGVWIGDVDGYGVDISLQAKMVFMMGMYWCARSPETERMRIRGFKVAG